MQSPTPFPQPIAKPPDAVPLLQPPQADSPC